MLLNAMAAGNDNLDNKHANTQVPKAVGFERIAELSGDAEYAHAAGFLANSYQHTKPCFWGQQPQEFFRVRRHQKRVCE